MVLCLLTFFLVFDDGETLWDITNVVSVLNKSLANRSDLRRLLDPFILESLTGELLGQLLRAADTPDRGELLAISWPVLGRLSGGELAEEASQPSDVQTLVTSG